MLNHSSLIEYFNYYVITSTKNYSLKFTQEDHIIVHFTSKILNFRCYLSIFSYIIWISKQDMPVFKCLFKTIIIYLLLIIFYLNTNYTIINGIFLYMSF